MTRFLVFAVLLFFSAAARAQSSVDTLDYVPGTVQNVSDALFKKGILKTDDPAAIEEYIRIHHCGLYEQYQRDDFSWGRIREAQARDLEANLNTLPDGLEVANLIPLTQYDMASGQFLIKQDRVLDRVGTLSVFKEGSGFLDVCERSFVPRVHPLDLVIKLDTPISLNTVPMDHNTANALLDIMNKRANPNNLEESRMVMVVFRVRITGIDPLSVVTDPMHRTVLGQIDDLRIYEGPNRKLMVYRKVFENPQAKSGKN